MRSGLAICFLIVLCIPGNAATRAHHAKSKHVISRSQGAVPAFVTPSGAHLYRDDSVPGGYRIGPGEAPVSYDDPSKYGGSP
ncbi:MULTISPECIES: hypothetical protein [unclassified Afipia]|jgi:hypothetical protein|uniref:hypothetical protein n=1 Tax=unclassified Afipia TaxID=2642050 RepID=UPI00042860FB|nr:MULTISPECIES: hypothetical protein [unclassified Afipia]MBQ8103016.1 hypothetical protein [Afipia sp.]MBS4004597.1 hypothetical protein [Afipia sp.]WIG53218.1 MAG: hypothetical protein OJF48_004138 [Afipia sp.]